MGSPFAAVISCYGAIAVFFVEIHDYNLPAFAGELFGDSLAGSRPGAGDETHLIGESHLRTIP
jgi:hypothetical protein